MENVLAPSETVVLLIPVILFCIDVLGKAGFGCSLDSIGIDLCMFGISFNISTLLLDRMMQGLGRACLTGDQAAALECIYSREAIIILSILVSVAAWMLAMMLTTSRPVRFVSSLRKLRADTVLAVALGMASFYVGIYLYYALG